MLMISVVPFNFSMIICVSFMGNWIAHMLVNADDSAWETRLFPLLVIALNALTSAVRARPMTSSDFRRIPEERGQTILSSLILFR